MRMNRQTGVTLMDFVFVFAIFAIIASISIPGIIAAERAGKARKAAEGPALNVDQLAGLAGMSIVRRWDYYRVILVSGDGGERFFHLDEAAYKLLKDRDRIDAQCLMAIKPVQKKSGRAFSEKDIQSLIDRACYSLQIKGLKAKANPHQY